MNTNDRELPDPISPEVLAHYEQGLERDRLDSPIGQLEFTRTKQILSRYLPPAPAVVSDVGGGTGVYALWLAEQGYEVHLIDPVPQHVEQAQAASDSQPEHRLAECLRGDARDLPADDSSVDAVLLLGPLYHLIDHEERVKALREAWRVLRPGGLAFAAGISRFASTLDGLREGFLNDPSFVEIARQDLIDGQHRNPDNHPAYFTTAYFHHSDELGFEIESAGLQHHKTIAIEGPAWLLGDLSDWLADDKTKQLLLDAVAWIEEERTLMGVSAHFMVLGRKAER